MVRTWFELKASQFAVWAHSWDPIERTYRVVKRKTQLIWMSRRSSRHGPLEGTSSCAVTIIIVADSLRSSFLVAVDLSICFHSEKMCSNCLLLLQLLLQLHLGLMKVTLWSSQWMGASKILISYYLMISLTIEDRIKRNLSYSCLWFSWLAHHRRLQECFVASQGSPLLSYSECLVVYSKHSIQMLFVWALRFAWLAGVETTAI